jgi:hypothetical protein
MFFPAPDPARQLRVESITFFLSLAEKQQPSLRFAQTCILCSNELPPSSKYPLMHQLGENTRTHSPEDGGEGRPVRETEWLAPSRNIKIKR